MAAVLAFLGSALAKIFTDKVLAYVAMKVILVGLFTLVVPIVLNNVLYDLMEIIMNFANTQSGSASSFSGTMSFSGFAAYLIETFRISECLSVLVSALILRTSLKMIPFVRF